MVDIEYFKRKQQLIELRYNPYHDPSNGRFTSGGGGGGGFLYSPNRKKGEKGMNGDGSAFYVAPDTMDKGEQALADEYGAIGEAGTGIAIDFNGHKKNYRITDTNLVIEITHNAASPIMLNGKLVKADEFVKKAIDSGRAEFLPKYKVKQLHDKALAFIPHPELGQNVFKEHGWGAKQKKTIIRYRRDGSAR